LFNGLEGYKARRKRILFQPIILPHFVALLFLAFFLFPLFLFFLGPVFRYGLGLPWFLVILVVWFSLLGSAINFPIKEFVSEQPIIVSREVSFFGFKWIIPEVVVGKQKTVLAVNLGGAIIPILVSFYLLAYSIPTFDPNPSIAYLKIFIVTVIIAIVAKRLSRVVPGLGIALPGFIPPLLTVILTLIVFPVYTLNNPYVIGYVSGTIGTLIGADILNLGKITKVGSPLISIGGAGTFDGIYLTGVMSVFLLLLLI